MNDYILLLTQAVPEGRVFGLDQQTLIQIGIQLLNTGILAVALTYILYKPVKNFLQKRTERISSEMKSAEEQMAKANELIADYDEKIEAIQQERTELLAKAEASAQEKRAQIIAEAKQDAEAIKEQQLQRAYDDSKRIQEEMRAQVIDFSALIAEKFIQGDIDEEAKDAYVNRITASMEDQAWPS